MFNKFIRDSEKHTKPIAINLSTTYIDVRFLLSPNSSVIYDVPIAADAATACNCDGYEAWKRHLLKKRETFKVRGLAKARTLEQIVQATAAAPVQLISGHLHPDFTHKRELKAKRRAARVHCGENANNSLGVDTGDGALGLAKKLDERNRNFLDKLIPAISRQLNSFSLNAKKKEFVRTGSCRI